MADAGVLVPDMYMPWEMMLRGGAAGLFGLIGVLLWRDHRGHAAGRLGAFFTAGVAAYALCSAGLVHATLGPVAAPIMALASANSFVFYLFTRAMFDDTFRLWRRHFAVWVALAGLGLACASGVGGGSLLGLVLREILASQTLVFALAALAATLQGWGGDLVEPRRRLRLVIVLAGAGHMIASVVPVLMPLIGGGVTSALAPGLPVGSAVESVLLLATAAMAAASLTAIDRQDAIFAPAYDAGTLPVGPAQEAHLPSDAASQVQIAHLEHTMVEDRLYRFDGLTIAQLARHQGIPETRLRYLIHKGLGYRNFASFVNAYRLADVRAALSDPAQAGVPILTIAQESGFTALAPFTRAFKLETGQTPIEFRHSTLRKLAPGISLSRSGETGGNRTGRISRSASD